MEPNFPMKKKQGLRSKTCKKTKKVKMEEEVKEHRRKKSMYKTKLETFYKPSDPAKDIKIRSVYNEKINQFISDSKSVNERLQLSKPNRPIIIGITGGSGSGKSLFSKNFKINARKMGISCSRIKEKNFLKSIEVEDELQRKTYLKNYDFDSHGAIDWELFKKCVSFLEKKVPFNTPIYDIFSQKRILKTKKIKPANLIIIEGRLFFNEIELRNKCDVKIFMDTDSDIMLSRRVFHNIARKKDLKEIISRYNKFVKPAYEKLIEPNKCYADLVIPNWGGSIFDMSKIEKNSTILNILLDLIKFRIRDLKKSKNKIKKFDLSTEETKI